MQRINELIVVEGNHDKDKLEKLFDCDILLTGGLALTQEKINIIKEASLKRGVIVMTDPDSPGKKIRDMIMQQVPNIKHVFIQKNKAIGKRNVGIEYVSDEDLIEALSSAVTFNDGNQSISWQEYLDLDLMDDKKKRDYFSTKLNLGTCNNKTLFKYLNMLDLSYQQLKDVCKDYGK